MHHLVLWDIDHTLIASRGVGRALSAAAFEQVTGQPMRNQAKIDGITEAVIFRETAKLHGITTDRSDFERFARALTEQHVRRAAELREHGSALPGAATALWLCSRRRAAFRQEFRRHCPRRMLRERAAAR
ncbi:hypothetical protein SRB5_53280 [Streptomyces sp. RB5]|uniref:Uncharacterized protein n=1 Tax=Streptomyces smaragdinus TaxID=2585196 RepID=A0A7K0CNT4_9ACTN|nr:hypothetical protein [Streptomyces smaragdinus]